MTGKCPQSWSGNRDAGRPALAHDMHTLGPSVASGPPARSRAHIWHHSWCLSARQREQLWLSVLTVGLLDQMLLFNSLNSAMRKQVPPLTPFYREKD